MLVPLGVVVAVAIVCIVVAALTSAHRADEVALEHEQKLLTRAIVNHGEWSLRRLNIMRPSDSVRARDLEVAARGAAEAARLARAAARSRACAGGRFSSDQIVYSQVGRSIRPNPS